MNFLHIKEVDLEAIIYFSLLIFSYISAPQLLTAMQFALKKDDMFIALVQSLSHLYQSLGSALCSHFILDDLFQFLHNTW